MTTYIVSGTVTDQNGFFVHKEIKVEAANKDAAIEAGKQYFHKNGPDGFAVRAVEKKQ